MGLKRKLRKGFTLVELVVVIAVIAILAAVSVGAYFGVTDSANASAAEQYKKQIKDLWIMYSVSQEYVEGNSDETITQNAEYFCMTYAKDNGPQNVIVNYRLIDINPSFSVSSLKDSTYTTTGVMFFIDSNYDTYFVTNGARIVIESDLIKSEDSFKNSMTEESTSFMSQEDRDTFKTLGFGAFELSNVGSEEEPVLGYKYFIVNVDGDLPDNNIEVPVNRSLASINENYKPNNVGYRDSNSDHAQYFGKTYEITENGVEVDTTVPFTHEHQTPTLIEGNKYSVGTINLTYTKLLNETYVNLYNFPICDYVNGKATYYKNFLDFKTNPNFANSEDTATHYIFVGNTSLNVDLTLPSNYNLIVEYSVNATSAEATATNVASMQSFVGLGYTKENVENTLMTGRYQNSNQFTSLESKITLNNWQFTVNEDVTLEINGMLLNEAYSYVANGNNSTVVSNACHIELNEGSKIILNNGSILRTLGVIDGDGEIIAKNGSTVVEQFKLTSFLGGSISAIVCFPMNFFPFMDYHIDSLIAKTIFEYGSSFKALFYVFIEKIFNPAIPLIGQSSLFTIEDDSSFIQKSYDLTTKRANLFIHGKVKDGTFSIPLKYSFISINLNNAKFNFPLTNMNIEIDVNSTLTLSAYMKEWGTNYYSHYEIMPSSSIINNGVININEGNKLIIANIQEYDFSGFTNKIAKEVGIKYSNLKGSTLFTNNGQISGPLYSWKPITNYIHNTNKYTLKILKEDSRLESITCYQLVEAPMSN